MEEGTGMAEAPVGLGGDEASLWRSRGAETRRTASSVRELVGGWWSGWMIEEGLLWLGGDAKQGRWSERSGWVERTLRWVAAGSGGIPRKVVAAAGGGMDGWGN